MNIANATTVDTVWFDHMPSPVGPLLLAVDRHGLRQVDFEHDRYPATITADWQRDPARVAFARVQLEEYFAGTRHAFTLPLHPRGTAFQREVWTALSRIPYGRTISYAQLAQWIGKPSAVRAVGAANGRNPLPIVVPCHRVIGADGSLTGFGGGLDAKATLLRLEGAVPMQANAMQSGAMQSDDLFA